MSDKEIREQLRKKYQDEEKRQKSRMDSEEQELRQYFSDIKKPINQDPTLVRRQRYNEKMSTYREVMKDVSIKSFVQTIWQYEGNTPEEIETLYDCKEFMKKRSIEGVALSLTATSSISFWNRRYLTKPTIVLGFFVGIASGIAMGFIRSTGYTLKRFEELGPDYFLGRLAQTEIEDFRLDKVVKK